MGLLDGKAAVVTGSGRGIGRGHALQLAKAGASVVVNDVDVEEAQKVAAEIGEFGGKAVSDSSDIASKQGAEALVTGGRVELLWRQSLWETIGGGTSEVMRGVVARQGLGLGGRS